jgi:hypothetical protein
MVEFLGRRHPTGCVGLRASRHRLFPDGSMPWRLRRMLKRYWPKKPLPAGLVVSLTEGQDAGLLFRPLLPFLLLRKPGCLSPGPALGHFFAAPSLIGFRLAAFNLVYQPILFGRLVRLSNGRVTLTFRRCLGTLYGLLRRQGRFSGRGKYDPHRGVRRVSSSEQRALRWLSQASDLRQSRWSR